MLSSLSQEQEGRSQAKHNMLKWLLVATLFTCIAVQLHLYYYVLPCTPFANDAVDGDGLLNQVVSLETKDHSVRKQNGISDVNCQRFLQEYLSGKVDDGNMGRALFRRTITDPPFYVSLHNKNVDDVRWPIMEKGQYYEVKLTEALQESLRGKISGETMVLDVGGNIGWYTLVAASLGHHVTTFEPNPLNLIRICESVQLNGWSDDLVRVHSVGVGDTHGASLVLYNYVRLKNPGSGTFKPRPGFNTTNHKTTVVTLDAIAKEKGWFNKYKSIAFLKVDVEGYEPQVFMGATKLIKSRLVENICFEMSSSRTTKSEREEIFRALIDAGYYLHMMGTWMGPGNPDVPKTTTAKQMLHELSLLRPRMTLNLWWKLSPWKRV